MLKKVYIENTPLAYARMFLDEGWAVTDDINDADLIQLIGGADINPALYGRQTHPTVGYSDQIDNHTLELYKASQELKTPIAGICRGSQFLHAMAGGELVQHCNNHAIHDTHLARMSWMCNETIDVSSTHHQMMYSDDVGDVLMWAENLATSKQTVDESGNIVELDTGIDIEAMYYPDINALSYQPHPEFGGVEDCRKAYFFMINNYLLGE